MSYPGPGSSWGTPDDGRNDPYTGGGQPDPSGGYGSGNSDATTHYGAYGDQGGNQYGESGTSAYGDQGGNQYGESGTSGYGNQPGQYGESGTGGYGNQPGQYGAQPGGYPPAGGGGYGGGTPPQPPYGGTPAPGSGGSGSNRTPLIIGIVVALLVAGGLIAFLVTRGNDNNKKDAQSQPPTKPSSQVVTNDSTFPTDAPDTSDTGGGSSAPSGITEDDARNTVNQYLDDINSQDDTDAATLICASKLAAWKSTIHDESKGGDFTIKVLTKKINDVTQTSDGYDVDTTINAQKRSGGDASSIDVTFVIIDEDGPKICDEKT